MKLRSRGASLLLAAAILLVAGRKAELNPLEAAVGPGWSATGYGGAKLRATGDALWIEADDEGGALLERTGLDRQKTYRLAISGSARFSNPVLRLKSDARPSNAARAPQGDLEITISDTEQLGLRIEASHDHFLYGIKFKLRECDDCASDEYLRSVITTELPEIESELETNLLPAVHRLLRWTARKVDLGGGVSKFADMTGVMSLMSAAQIYDTLWKADRGGASCGAFAAFFRKVLALFNVRSFVIDIGYLGSYLTHVTTVVPVRTGSEVKFYIFDPTFGGTYLTRDGSYADLRSMLTSPQSVTFSAAPVIRTAIISDANWRRFYRAIHKLRRDPSCRRMDGFRICDRFAYDAAWLLQGWRPMLRRHGIPKKADLILALLKHRVISTSARGNTLQAFRAVLAASRG